MYPLERRIALRSHCSPKARSSAPTTRRSVPIGTTRSAGPSAATSAARTIVGAPTPISVERQPRTTMGGVTLVAGFRPELWRDLVPEDAPRELEGFNRDIVGPDGYTIPATQHDAVLWISGSAYDVIFDMAREAIAALEASGS